MRQLISQKQAGFVNCSTNTCGRLGDEAGRSLPRRMHAKKGCKKVAHHGAGRSLHRRMEQKSGASELGVHTVRRMHRNLVFFGNFKESSCIFPSLSHETPSCMFQYFSFSISKPTYPLPFANISFL